MNIELERMGKEAVVAYSDIPAYVWKNWRFPQNVVGVSTEIRAGHLWIANKMRYRMIQLALLGPSVVRQTSTNVW